MIDRLQRSIWPPRGMRKVMWSEPIRRMVVAEEELADRDEEIKPTREELYRALHQE